MEGAGGRLERYCSIHHVSPIGVVKYPRASASRIPMDPVTPAPQWRCVRIGGVSVFHEGVRAPEALPPSSRPGAPGVHPHESSGQLEMRWGWGRPALAWAQSAGGVPRGNAIPTGPERSALRPGLTRARWEGPWADGGLSGQPPGGAFAGRLLTFLSVTVLRCRPVSCYHVATRTPRIRPYQADHGSPYSSGFRGVRSSWVVSGW